MKKAYQDIKINLPFILGYSLCNYTANMGQYALTTHFCDGDKEVYTTPMDSNRGSDKGDFASLEEMLEAVKMLKEDGKQIMKA